MRYNLLTALVIVLILSTIAQQSYIIIKVQEVTHISIQGYAESDVATIELCYNYQPENITTNCNSTLDVGVEINCQVSAVDEGGGTLTYSSSLISEGTNALTTNPNGSITIKTYNGTLDADPPLFEYYEHLLGNHTYMLTANDGLGCGNSAAAINYYLEIYDSNDPPFLAKSIPDRTIPLNQEVVMFRLNDYFRDPENQALTYNYSGSSSILLNIWGTSDVVALTTNCVTATFVFTATDPHGESVNSNSVEIESDCEEQTDGSEGGGSSSSGGGSSSCTSQWNCGDWSRCTPNGTTIRTCIDMNRCNPDYFIHEMELECTYVSPADCMPEWSCEEWGLCQPDGTQTRTCSDLNSCNKNNETPTTMQDCTYNPTCSDGVKNQNETGVDCGGPCLPCKRLEVPGIIKEQRTLISTIIILLIFIIMSLLIAYKYFHKQVNTTIAKMLLSLTKKREKRILLTDKDKTYLLKKLLELEKNITTSNLNNKAMELSEISRGYFSSIFKIPLTVDKNTVEQYTKQLKINELLSNVLLSFFDLVVVVETKELRMFKTDLLIMTEELREIIHQTSNFLRDDIGKEIEEMKIGKSDKPVIMIKKQIYNTYIAMHFDEIEAVKNKYSELMNSYENLSESNKGKVYEDVQRLFNEIRYLISIMI